MAALARFKEWLHDLPLPYLYRAEGDPALAAPALEPLPGMTSWAERSYFQAYARDDFEGRGELVDLGCWLGATTVALASGLSANPRWRAARRRVHAFDSFVWRPYMDRFLACMALAVRCFPGESFLPLFLRQVGPWRRRVRAHRVDLAEVRWRGGPVEFLLVDALKNWRVANAVVRAFYPVLLPGAVVVHQDFAHAFTPWIHPLQHRLRRCFEPVADIPESCSLVFRVRRRVDARVLEVPYGFASFSPAEVEDAFAHSRSQVDPAKHARLAAGEVMWFVYAGQPSLARRALERHRCPEYLAEPEFVAAAKAAERNAA
jgi:hypothetical protein